MFILVKNTRLELTLWSSLLAMRLHGDVSIQVVQCTVGLFAAVPATLVHALNFFISSPRSLVLLRAWNRDERVNLRWVRHSRMEQITDPA